MDHVLPRKLRLPQATRLSLLFSFCLRSGLKICLVCVAVLLVTEVEAYAYTDPGSGALLWQAVLAGFFSALFYIRKIRAWIASGRRDKKNVE